MDFANVLKKLRKNSNVTQEQLANHLSLSSQAISRWETATAMPDISFLPRLASYFGVSVDYLLGVDFSSYDEKINKICEEAFFYEEDTKKDYYEKLKIYRRGIMMYPRSWKLKLELAKALLDCHESSFHSFTEDETLANLYEMNALCEDIVLHCDNSHYKYDALNYLSLVAKETYNVSKVRQYITDLPEVFRSFEPLMVRILTGDEKERIIDDYLRKMDIEICSMLLEKSKDQDRSITVDNYLKSCAVHEALSDIYVFDLIREGQITDWWDLFVLHDEWDMLLNSLEKSIAKANKIAAITLSEDKKYIYGLLLTHFRVVMEWIDEKLTDSEQYDSIIDTAKKGEELVKSKVVNFIRKEG